MRVRVLIGCLATAVVTSLAIASGAQAAGITCGTVTVPVAITEDGPRDHQLAGQLCRPAGSAPKTVQLLVHGGTYNRSYWDWPDRRPYYSYVRAAVAAGYATFAVDRLGAGASSHPPSTAVNVANGATALHDLVGQLRGGQIGGTAFRRVIWVGHSAGSAYAWAYAARFADIDGFVITGLLHVLKQSAEELWFSSIIPAGGGLDPGYVTTVPGTRDDLFYHLPTTEPAVVATDETTKDTATAAELENVNPLITGPPDGAPSRAIRVPTLIVMGAEDRLFCGPPDGVQCTRNGIRAHEGPYYSPEAQLEVSTISRTAHNLTLHLTAPLAYGNVLAWTLRRFPPDPDQLRWVG